MLGEFDLRRDGEWGCTGEGTPVTSDLIVAALEQTECGLLTSYRNAAPGRAAYIGHDAVQALLELGERLDLTLPLELLLTADAHLHAAILHLERLSANGHGPRALQRLVRAEHVFART